MRARLGLWVSGAMACLVVAVPQIAMAEGPTGQLVSEVAAARTPHILDGRVYSIAQVGNQMILGGTFTRVRNDVGDTSAQTRRGLVAFDATSGRISDLFDPGPDGIVRSVIPAGDGSSVYVGGSFTSIGGVRRSGVARVRVADGAVIDAFDAGPVTGQVRDLDLRDDRLWIGGAFTHIGGRERVALATLHPTTGALSDYMSLPVEGVHNQGATQVLQMDISSDGSQLAAVGNFDTVAGVRYHQFLTLDLTGEKAVGGALRTNFYTAACADVFETYMRDVDFSPDGSYLVIGTTGAYRGGTGPCDTVARFESGSAGSNVAPSWVDYTGGDTTSAVEATTSAIYVGGHARWWNNPFAGDRPGPGAIPREGIVALDPTNGLPLSWDPGRDKGVGVFDFLMTRQGLWIASDTDRIGEDQYRGRIARLPVNGTSFRLANTPGLPNAVYAGGAPGQGPALTRRSFTGSAGGVGTPRGVRGAGLDWSSVRGAFMVHGSLFLSRADGDFEKRRFDGTTLGEATLVNGHDQLVRLGEWHSDAASVTGMFFDGGRIYYSLAGSKQLFYRYFTVESGVVGARRYRASATNTKAKGIDFSTVRGMFVTPSDLFWATTNGNLHRVGWNPQRAGGRPVGGGKGTVVSGPRYDGQDWTARALFLFQDASGNGTGTPPTASFVYSCTGLRCSFNGAGSTAFGGSITDYTWTFDDDRAAASSAPNHEYAVAGSYRVTLTVTSSDGGVDSSTRRVRASMTAGSVQFVAAETVSDNTTVHRVTLSSAVRAGDRLVLYLTLNSAAVTITPPAGWIELDEVLGRDISAYSWTRQATSSDSGNRVKVTTSDQVKSDFSFEAYRGVGSRPTIVTHSATVDSLASTRHRAPALPLPSAAVVSTRWIAKSSVDISWTTSRESIVRGGAEGSGGGHLTSVAVNTVGELFGWPSGAEATSVPAVSRTVVFATAVGVGRGRS